MWHYIAWLKIYIQVKILDTEKYPVPCLEHIARLSTLVCIQPNNTRPIFHALVDQNLNPNILNHDGAMKAVDF